MSRTLFRLEIPQAVRDENLTGRQLTERGFAVNKYAAASTTPAVVTDNAQAFVDALNAQSPGSATIDADTRVIRIHNEERALPEGNFTFIGWKFEIGADGGNAGSLHIAVGDANRNLYFVNCNVEVVNLDDVGGFNTFSIGYGQAADGATRTDDQFADTEAASRGINSYGSLWVYDRGVANQSIRFADFIDSEIIWQGAAAQIDSSNGGRHIRSTFNKYEGNAQQIRPYGPTEVQGSIYNNFFFRHGNTGSNQPSQLVVDRPRFLPTGTATPQVTAIDLNVPGIVVNDVNNDIPGVTLDDRSLPVQLIGGPSLGASATEALGTTRDLDARPAFTRIGTRDGVVQMDSLINGYSGIIQYYGVGDRYFADGAQTAGAQGIRVRIDGTINPNTVNSTQAILGNRMFAETGADFVNGNVSLIGQTGADGRLETFEWISGADRRSGHVNFFEWRDEAGTGGNVWATNVDQTFSPAGMMLMPIARAYVTRNASETTGTDADLNYDNIRVNVRRRGFRWDVNEAITQIAHPAVREQLEIPTGSIVAPDLLGVRVKAAFVNADNTPNDTAIAQAFGGGAQLGTASINDIDNAFRSLWFEEQTDHTPDSLETHADNYDLNLNDSLSAPFTITGTGGNTIFNVRCNGLAPEADDVIRTRIWNSVGLNGFPVDDQDITAGLILGPRTGETPAQFAFRNNVLIGSLVVPPNESIYFDNVNVSQLDMSQSGTGTTIIRGTDHNGNALTMASFNNVNGSYTFEAPPVTLMIQPDVPNEAVLRTRGGFWRVVDSTGTVLQTHDITATSTLADVTYTFFSTDTNDVRAWYQPRANVGGYTAVYGYTLVRPSDQTNPGTFRVTPFDFSLLVANTVTDRTSELNITTDTSGGANMPVLNVRATVTGGSVGLAHTMEIAIAILNDSQYIDAVVARGYTAAQRTIEFLFGENVITQYNGGFDGGAPRRPLINLFVEGGTQTGIAFTQGYLSNPTTGNSNFFDTTSVNIFVGVNDAITALETSNTMQEIDNKTSYLVTNGGRTQADVSRAGGRFGGIRPKQADYNTDIDYTTVT